MATGASSGTNEATVRRWSAEISGPIAVDSSSGSPTTISATASSRRSMKRSSAERSTRIRERAQQSCPALPNTAPGAAAAARSRSASANTMFADLPPSSSVTRLMVPAAPCGDPAPDLGRAGERDLGHVRVLHEPLPADASPGPATTFSTPSGRPGLQRDPLELERRERRELGRLQDHRVAGGQRGRHLPRGDREREVPGRDQRRPPRAARGTSCPLRRPPGSSCRSGARGRRRSSGRCPRPCPSRRGRRRSACRRCAPRAVASSSACSSRASASRCSTALRSAGGSARHAGKAALARSTAASVSSTPARGTSAITSAVAGSITCDHRTADPRRARASSTNEAITRLRSSSSGCQSTPSAKRSPAQLDRLGQLVVRPRARSRAAPRPPRRCPGGGAT